MSKSSTLSGVPEKETATPRGSRDPEREEGLESATRGSGQAKLSPSPPANQPTSLSASGRRQSDLIVGTGPAMVRVAELMSVVARTQIPVLLQGASGTGKELVARDIH
ncbi:MAG: sigma 54-interacting transcriptional regulator, partial [Acidobacteriota bacterium]